VLHRLVDLRKEKKWSLQETADRLGIAKSTYAGYESGYREPSLQALSEIADLYGVTVDYILNRDNHKYPIIELEKLLTTEDSMLSLDEIPLTIEDLCDCIAFIRVKRGVKEVLPK